MLWSKHENLLRSEPLRTEFGLKQRDINIAANPVGVPLEDARRKRKQSEGKK